MTHKDIYTKFMIEYDKANVTSSYPSLTEYEVATLLDKAYLALIARKLTGNNPRQSPFEADIKSISDLQPLITHADPTVSSSTHVAPNVAQFSLPSDFLYYVTSALNRGVSNPMDRLTNRLVPMKLVSHDTATRFFATPYNLPWVKVPVCYVEDNKMFVAYDSVKSPSINSAHLTYIKKPNPFALSIPTAPVYDDDDPDNGNAENTGGGTTTGSWAYVSYNYSDSTKKVNVIFSNGTDTCGASQYVITGGSSYASIGMYSGEVTPKQLDGGYYQVQVKVTCERDSSVTRTITINVKTTTSSTGSGTGESSTDNSYTITLVLNYISDNNVVFGILYGGRITNNVSKLTISENRSTTGQNGSYTLYKTYPESGQYYSKPFPSTMSCERSDSGYYVRFTFDDPDAERGWSTSSMYVPAKETDNGSLGGNWSQGGSGYTSNSKIKVAVFDFANPTTLNANGNFQIPTSPTQVGELVIGNTTFTEGPITITDTGRGNLTALLYRENVVTGEMEYRHVMRGHALIRISTTGNYYLKTIYLDGSIGDIGEANSATNTWSAGENKTVTEQYFTNGTIHSALSRIIVTYSEGPVDEDEHFVLLSSTPSNNSTVTSSNGVYSKGIWLNFNIPILYFDSTKFHLYRLTNPAGEVNIEAKNYGSGLVVISPTNDTIVDGNYRLLVNTRAMTHGSAENSEFYINFTVKSEGGGDFNRSYTYNVLRNYSNLSNMEYNELNNIILFALVPDEYSDMIPDPSKTGSIVAIHSLSEIATGHFEPYAGDIGIAGCKAIKFVLDEPFTQNDIRIKNNNGTHACLAFPTASFGDANFGKWLRDPSSVSKQDCIVNANSSSFSFIISNEGSSSSGSSYGTSFFDFRSPSTLNPPLNPSTGVGDVLAGNTVYNTVFTSGPVTIRFVDYGQGVAINNGDNTGGTFYTLSLRQRASMKISVSGDYVLTSIGFYGSIGSIKQVSSSTKTWIAYDESTKEVLFENGTEETYIQAISVRYKIPGTTVPSSEGNNDSSSTPSGDTDTSYNYWYHEHDIKILTSTPGEVQFECFYQCPPLVINGSYCTYQITDGTEYANIETGPSSTGTLAIIKPKVADGIAHNISIGTTFALPSGAAGSEYSLHPSETLPYIHNLNVIKLKEGLPGIMLEYDRRRGVEDNDGDDYRITISPELASQTFKYRMLVEPNSGYMPSEWQNLIVDGWKVHEDIAKSDLSNYTYYNTTNSNSFLYHLPIAQFLRESDHMWTVRNLKVQAIDENDNVICESNTAYII